MKYSSNDLSVCLSVYIYKWESMCSSFERRSSARRHNLEDIFYPADWAGGRNRFWDLRLRLSSIDLAANYLSRPADVRDRHLERN